MKFLYNCWHEIVSGDNKGFIWLLARLVLSLFSLLYLVILKVRYLLYAIGLIKRTSLDVLVISVGNLTLGGTGKTPMTAYLARTLAQKGQKCAILSRGYGKTCPDVTSGSEPEDDEGFVFSELPEGIQGSVTRHTGSNRAKIAREICRQSATDVIILDDGFQHLRIKRDIDIVMINSLAPFGNGRLLPAGYLREPRRALYRADLFVLAHTDLVSPDKLSNLINYLARFKRPVVKSIHKPIGLIPINAKDGIELETLRSRKVWAFCGIGSPLSFQKTLQHHGINPVGFRSFPDHYCYEAPDLAELEAQAKQAKADILLTTQKDQVRLSYLGITSGRMSIYALKVELDLVEGKEVLEKVLQNL